MWRRSSIRTILAAAAVLAAVAALTSGCGASGGTITVEAALPAAGVDPAAVPVADEAVSVGPGAVTVTLARRGYEIHVHVTPNRATAGNRISLTLRRNGATVAGARVVLAATMTTMDMGTARYVLHGTSDYSTRAPAWVMTGTWQLTFGVTPPGGRTFRFALGDRLR